MAGGDSGRGWRSAAPWECVGYALILTEDQWGFRLRHPITIRKDELRESDVGRRITTSASCNSAQLEMRYLREAEMKAARRDRKRSGRVSDSASGLGM